MAGVCVPVAPFGAQGDQGEIPFGTWQCSGCGFQNKQKNKICGGFGTFATKGCKKPFSASEDATLQADGNCAVRSFVNTAQNDVGETTQPLRCAPSTMAGVCVPVAPFGAQGDQGEIPFGTWQCSGCGFQNKQKNKICGGFGTFATKGCKKPFSSASGDVILQVLPAEASDSMMMTSDSASPSFMALMMGQVGGAASNGNGGGYYTETECDGSGAASDDLGSIPSPVSYQ